MTNRRKRSDSVESQIEAVQRVKKGLSPSYDLTTEERAIFQDLIAGLPLDQWDSHDIRLVTTLARIERHLEVLIDDVVTEGAMILNDRGTPVSNPKQSAMTTTAQTVKSLRATLGLSASQRGVSKSSMRQRKEAEKEARDALSGEEDGLLA